MRHEWKDPNRHPALPDCTWGADSELGAIRDGEWTDPLEVDSWPAEMLRLAAAHEKAMTAVQERAEGHYEEIVRLRTVVTALEKENLALKAELARREGLDAKLEPVLDRQIGAMGSRIAALEKERLALRAELERAKDFSTGE